MLSKSHRLNLNDWPDLRQFKRVSTSLFLCYFQTTNTAFKGGVVATKKNFPKAVTRNYYKRVIFEIMNQLNPNSGKLLVIVSKNILNSSFSEIKSNLMASYNSIKYKWNYF